ncbi:tetratricopeptide repeat protein [bacterium]|nr:tetratricopeptide repeat protein [bacterium]
MKKIIFIYHIILATLFTFPLYAQENKSSLADAEELYLKNDFQGALNAYKNYINNEKKPTDDILFNLGILEEMSGNSSKALAAYTGAYLLKPSNPQNRKIFFSHLNKREGVQDDPFFNLIGQFRPLWLISIPVQIAGFVVAWLFFCLSPLFISEYKKVSLLRSISFIISLLGFISLGLYSYINAQNWAVVIGGNAPVYANFVEKTKPLYEYPQNSTIRIVSALNPEKGDPWYQVKLPDGSLGWMEYQHLIKVMP